MDRAYLQQLFSEHPFPAEAADALLAAFDAICADAALAECIQSAVNKYENGTITNQDDMLEQLLAIRAQATGGTVSSYQAEVLYFLLCTRHLKQLYIRKSLPMAYFDGVVLDIISKLDECIRVKGIWGSFVATWFIWFFTLDRFAIGRLQFEIIPMPASISLDGKTIFNGQPAVNIHIPSGRPLLREQVRASMKEAAAFYADRFPGDSVLFTCHSWLLFPGHSVMLPEGSNIRQFLEEFTLIHADVYPDRKNLWRIFDTMDVEDLEKLPQNTTLQKSYVNWIKAGNPLGSGLGYRYLPKP